MKNARNAKRYQARGQAHGSGFTLIELLVVVTIIIIMMGLLLGAIVAAEKYAKISAIRSYIGHLSAAIETYHADFNFYPDSSMNNNYTAGHLNSSGIFTTSAVCTSNSTSVSNGAGNPQLYSGSARLAESLTGYLPYGTFNNGQYNNDGDAAGPGCPNAVPDPALGFRMAAPFSTGSTTKVITAYVPPRSSGTAVGKIYGPYMTVTPNNYITNPNPPANWNDQYFIDPLGNRILYYKANTPLNLNPSAPGTVPYFGNGTSPGSHTYTDNGIFNQDDNYSVINPNTALPQTFNSGTGTYTDTNSVQTAPTDALPAATSGNPGYASAQFLKLLGNTGGGNSSYAGNNLVNTNEAPVNYNTYLLVSPGINGIYLDGNNIINKP